MIRIRYVQAGRPPFPINRGPIRRTPVGQTFRSDRAMRPFVLSPRGRRLGFSLVACCALLGATPAAHAPERRAAEVEDGYDLWLRYRPIVDAARLAEYRSTFTNIVVETSSPMLDAARAELERGLNGLLARSVTTSSSVAGNGVLVLGTPASSKIIAS